eukprot:862710-Rhodomonas_salina.2
MKRRSTLKNGQDKQESQDHVAPRHCKKEEEGCVPQGWAANVDKQAVTSLFHLPINDAAAHFKIGRTAFKRLCRSFGIEKWPYRASCTLKDEAGPDN